MVWSAGQNSWRRIHLKIKTNLTNVDHLTILRSNRARYDFFCRIFHKSCWYFAYKRLQQKYPEVLAKLASVPQIALSLDWMNIQVNPKKFAFVLSSQWKKVNTTAGKESINGENNDNSHCNLFLMRSLKANYTWIILMLKTAAAAASKKNSRNVEKV